MHWTHVPKDRHLDSPIANLAICCEMKPTQGGVLLKRSKAVVKIVDIARMSRPMRHATRRTQVVPHDPVLTKNAVDGDSQYDLWKESDRTNRTWEQDSTVQIQAASLSTGDIVLRSSPYEFDETDAGRTAPAAL
jgi:hypothetical protein